MPRVKPEGDDGKGRFHGQDVGVVVATAVLGDSIGLGYQAVYARRQNSGFVGADSLGRAYNQAGKHFVERAATLWPACVKEAVRLVKEGVDV